MIFTQDHNYQSCSVCGDFADDGMGNLLVTAVWIGRMNKLEFLMGLFYGMVFGLAGGSLVYLLYKLIEK